MKRKIIRTSTVPVSLNSLLKGQLKYLSQYYEIVGISTPADTLDEVAKREGIRTVGVAMERKISLYKDLISLVKLIILFHKEKPYIVHSITPKAGLLSMTAAWTVRVPVRIHTFTGLIFPTSTGMTQKLLIAMDRLTCYFATTIIPEGKGVKRDLEAYRITSKPLKVLANGNVNGIDTSFFRPLIPVERENLRSQYGFTASDFVFIFVGRIVRDKGINELVSVFMELAQERSEIKLLLVGDFEKKLDPVNADVEQAICNHTRIKFVGFQSDVRPFLAASDALVFPSYREGFPNVVMQAGAMGLPSIVTDINGCNEIIIPDKNGVIIPPKNEQALYNAMLWFISHPIEIREMANNARPLIVSRYEQKMVWEALLKEYQELLSNERN